MGETFKTIKFLSLLLIIFASFNTSYASTDNIEKARTFFLEGKYLNAIEVCKSLNTQQSLILQSRISCSLVLNLSKKWVGIPMTS